ncbi:acyl-CoA dehydrogenase family protein [Ramlibacter sp.]|uniref:acyl-CoA dehydrogenase family protein n=1 Tax=Ramlibacter sp. TaxID=1917967 RepID=UPI003D0F1A4D
MNFTLNDDHIVLRDSAHAFLRKEVDLAPLLVPGAGAAQAPYAELWPKVREMGWPGMAVPEAHGGLGMTDIDLALVARECGRFLAPAPLFGAFAGTWALLAAASESQQARVLPDVAAGASRLALAYLPASGDAEAAASGVQAAAHADGRHVLTGTSHYVVDAVGADRFVVAAMLEGQRRLFLADAGEVSVRTRLLEWRDITRQVAHVDWDAAPAELLPVGWDEAWPGIRNRLFVLLAAESAGGLQAVLDDTAAYARERVAFGRPIGAYQAIKHGLADMLAQAECAGTAMLYGAWALSQDDETATLAAALAQSFASEAYRDATHRSIQMFGAIGFTWEMKNHLYFKRARGNASLLGAPAAQRELIAGILERRAGAPSRHTEGDNR